MPIWLIISNPGKPVRAYTSAYNHMNLVVYCQLQRSYCFLLLWNILGNVHSPRWVTWWRHQIETFSALLAICAGNSPVPGEFPTQRQVTQSLDVFFDLRLNKRLSQQCWGWWFETLSRPLWRNRSTRLRGRTGIYGASLITRFMGPTWGPSGTDRAQVGPILAPWNLLSGVIRRSTYKRCVKCCIGIVS